ncbi:MAG TPA: VWA domain-containing protein [Vicinamibacterales bacterium]|jgi:Ca-activated chloride channel family protein|nr:VWA domain-containing protein [Vicinamibacterales bacterium]
MRTRALVFVLTAITAVGAAALTAQTPTFRTGIDLASFGVTVVDKKGEYLSDLNAEDFEILEDGQKQTLKYFARGTDIENGPEMHIGLLFDTSASMTEDIKLSRSAAIKFLNTLSEAKDMTLVDFDTEVRVAKYGQRDFPRLVERIRGRTPDGETAMYDAMGVYLDGASDDEGRKILVLYTDGGDTHSTISFGDLMTLIRASDVTVYSVGFLEHSRGRIEERAHLQQIAEATGGQAFFPTSMKDIEASYDKVVAQIRAQYSLAYSSTNTKQDGAWRKVEIRVSRPDLKGSKILARRGYFAPYQEPPAKTK